MLADKVELAPTYISQLANGVRNIGESTARKIESRLGRPTFALDQPNAAHEPDTEQGNTSPILKSLVSVPVISWVQAGQWSEIIDSHHPGDGEAFVSVPGRVGKHGFALRVEGDSMMNSGAGDSFPPGITIIVDPDVQAKTGSYVVVRLDNEDQATFKQLIIDGGKRYLKPLNDRYPLMEITAPATICGVVVASFKRYI